MLTNKQLTLFIKNLGFEIVGYSNPLDLKSYHDRVAIKKDSGMLYNRKMPIEDYINVNKVVSNAKTIISVGMVYHQKPVVKTTGLSGYYTKSSYGIDYHKLIYPKLLEIVSYIEKEFPTLKSFVSCDTKILDDRYFAFLCGNGFYGKNSMIINETFGSEVFYGTIVLDEKFDFIQPKLIESKCYDCNRCELACPTQSLDKYCINYKTCLSYLTQSKEMIDPIVLKDSIYGCDICNNSCPFNNIKTQQPSFKEDSGYKDLIKIIKSSNKEYQDLFKDKGLLWLNKNIIKKNAILVLSNYYEYEQLIQLKDSMKINSSLLEDAFNNVLERKR